MPQLDYCIMDVFTDTALAGNPLAVVFNTSGLSSGQMQSIAREFNLSETTFVERRTAAQEQAEGVRVRIFTTQEELPFAGHPTLGTASALRLSAPETLCGGTITLALNVGSIPVRFETAAAKTDALFAEMTQRDPELSTELDPAQVARLIGLSVEDLDTVGPQVVSTGTAFAIVPLRSVASLARLNLNQAESSEWLHGFGARWFYVLAPVTDPVDPGPKYRARMQFNGGEDPATGSAAGCAISLLVARGMVASGERILLRQGVEICRPSDLFLSARREGERVTDVRVGGSTVLVAKGHLFLP